MSVFTKCKPVFISRFIVGSALLPPYCADFAVFFEFWLLAPFSADYARSASFLGVFVLCNIMLPQSYLAPKNLLKRKYRGTDCINASFHIIRHRQSFRSSRRCGRRKFKSASERSYTRRKICSIYSLSSFRL